MMTAISWCVAHEQLLIFLALLVLYVLLNWLPRTPPATQPWRSLFALMECGMWTAWDKLGFAYKGKFGPVPTLDRKTLTTTKDSVRPPMPSIPRELPPLEVYENETAANANGDTPGA